MGSTPPMKHGEMVVDSDEDDSRTEVTQHLLEKEGILAQEKDLEAQQAARPKDVTSGSHAAEYQVPTSTKYIYLGFYFGLNLSLTLFNKAVLGKVACRSTLVSEHC